MRPLVSDKWPGWFTVVRDVVSDRFSRDTAAWWALRGTVRRYRVSKVSEIHGIWQPTQPLYWIGQRAVAPNAPILRAQSEERLPLIESLFSGHLKAAAFLLRRGAPVHWCARSRKLRGFDLARCQFLIRVRL